MFKAIADNREPNSIAAKLRRRRTAFFASLLAPLEKPVWILDIGGTEQYWRMMNLPNHAGLSITLLNLEARAVTLPGCVSVRGDARSLEFDDQSFDVVFSNSVIEHVGDFHNQMRMANEARRVGKRYFVQTPNRYFPIEPHFVFPLFQFLPIQWRVWLLTHFNLGWFARMTDRDEARQVVEGIRLLGRDEIKTLFPGALIYEERFFLLTKSFVAYGGWEK